jgi:hypothetical protein
MFFRWTERRDDQVMGTGLHYGGKVRIVETDFFGDAVQGLDEAAVVLVDARELPSDLVPGDPGLRPGGPTAIEEVGRGVPEEGAGVEPAHQRQRQDDRIVAQVLMEGRIEDDAVALEVRGRGES